MGGEGFWDDSERAAAVSAEHARTVAASGGVRRARARLDDLDALAELAEEDPSSRPRSRSRWPRSRQRLDELEEQRLFSGPYDTGDALVTVNAGAGGTDAQDWAEMVLRMEMRWAERRGFDVELLEVSPGEEAGIKSATFRVNGENAYGLFGAERGRAPARAAVAVRLRPPPPDELRRRRGRRRSWRTSARSRSTRTTCRSTPTAPAAPAASTSTRPTRRCGSRTAHRDRGAVPERALAVLQPGHGDGDAARRSCSSARSANASEEIAREKGEAPGRQLRLADPLLRAAPLHDGQGPPHRTTRWATSTACSTATSTGSSAPTCCWRGQPPGTSRCRTSSRSSKARCRGRRRR